MKDLNLNNKDPHEKFANDFALNLLMPEKLIRRQWRKHRNISKEVRIIAMVRDFDIPAEIMKYRLRELNLLTIKGEKNA